MNEEKITTSANKKLSPEEIKRVKGLGCLQDKRYDDIFNIRVITGNGHITTDEHRAIADAADKFGNGQKRRIAFSMTAITSSSSVKILVRA